MVVCFLGTGLGCYLAAQPASPVRLGGNLLLLVTLVANPLHWDALNLHQISYLLSGFEDSPLWQGLLKRTTVEVLGGLLVVVLLTYLTAFIFVPAGQVLGQAFQQHPHTIRAYSVNIAGSLLGVWLFNTPSWAELPPTIWFQSLRCRSWAWD